MIHHPHFAKAEGIHIPFQFEEGQIIEQLIIVSDVDGVIRENVEALADPQVIHAFKMLLKNKNVHVTFISGTPIHNDRTVETWRQGNVPLKNVFGLSFEQELLEERVTIFGALGGHRMKRCGALEVVEGYPIELIFELGCLLIRAFLKEVLHHGNTQQASVANRICSELDSIRLINNSQPLTETPKEFCHIVHTIREHLDSDFRLISNGSMIETHTSSPLWQTSHSSKWLQAEIEKPEYLASALVFEQRQIASGIAHKGEKGFNFLLISKTNKGLTTKEYIAEKKSKLPNALVVSIGDTQVDFPMHYNADLAFHLGLERVLQDNPLSHCIMIRGPHGEESQHLEGTLKILKFLEKGIGKSFYDLKHIQKRTSSGKWKYCSLRDFMKTFYKKQNRE
ncbi:MAG: hypothetical protein H0X51_02860 [Parachlamydiaceae bacterium]|nr:hypothetical protein [Parachlamydiaceae bacterium]